MRYASFEITNFKGIAALTLDLDRQPSHPVHTLVGLNESGKTTILEALDWFFAPHRYDASDLVPKRLKANFAGQISVKAILRLDDGDDKELTRHLKDLDFIAEDIPERISITRQYTYSASDVQKRETLWAFRVHGKKKRAKTRRSLSHYDEIWSETVTYIEEHMKPPVIYYENFLFDIPDRIYLSGPKAELPGQAEYRAVIQDVLNSLEQDLGVEQHLVARFESAKKRDLDNIQAVLDMAETHMTNVVVQAWREIVKMSDRNLQITLGGTLHRDEEDRSVFLQVRIREGSTTYYIRERSLGFRWFLGFVLFTHFRTFRDNERRNAVFLLDEPASNLHPTAQNKLLGAFAELPERQPVVYSTHSHHMIRPEWLANTFVVKNGGMDYSDLGLGYRAEMTEITAERYFRYASKHPNDTDLFRPILDALDYQPGQLEMVPAIAVVEGKNDFYALRMLSREVLGDSAALPIYPSTGKDKTEYVIGLYLAWGREFVVMLDADPGGVRTKKRLRKLYGAAVDGRIFDLSDVDPKWSGWNLEALFDKRDQAKLVREEFPDSPEVTKSRLNTGIQAVLLSNRHFDLNRYTAARGKKLLDFLREKLPGST